MASLFPPSGPTLPPFRTLLIQGPYHPTAPIHLVLSHTTENPSAKAILLSTSKKKLFSSLKESLDDWLATHGSDGRVCNSASRVNIHYPRSPAHLALLLSMLHTYNGAFYHPKTTIDSATSLLVLHELSAYFLLNNSEATVSSYLSLVSHALAAATTLSSDSSDVVLALFDSGLEQLKLPIIRPVSHDASDGNPPPIRSELVAGFVQRYFQWVGVVEVDIEVAHPAVSGRMVMITLRGGSEDEITWKWSESGDAGGVTFSWQ